MDKALRLRHRTTGHQTSPLVRHHTSGSGARPIRCPQFGHLLLLIFTFFLSCWLSVLKPHFGRLWGLRKTPERTCLDLCGRWELVIL